MNSLETLLSKIKPLPNMSARLNYTREFVQALYLAKLQQKGWFKHCGFMGGTCLRLCFDLERFSEDLDFVLTSEKKKDPNLLTDLLKSANRQLESEGFKIRMKSLQSKTNIWKTFVVFDDLLHSTRISPNQDETLQIKIEVDVNPPTSFQTEIGAAANSDREIIASNLVRGVPSSLFGGKMHAVLFRAFTKGRDFFDLDWYLRKRIPVNITVLEDTEKSLGRKASFTRSSLIAMLISKIEETDLDIARRDVAPFVERPDELALIFQPDPMKRLVEDLRFWRPVEPKEFMARIQELLGSPPAKQLESRLDERFFEIKKTLDEEGIFPDDDLENSRKAILARLRKMQ